MFPERKSKRSFVGEVASMWKQKRWFWNENHFIPFMLEQNLILLRLIQSTRRNIKQQLTTDHHHFCLPVPSSRLSTFPFELFWRFIRTSSSVIAFKLSRGGAFYPFSCSLRRIVWEFDRWKMGHTYIEKSQTCYVTLFTISYQKCIKIVAKDGREREL